MQNGVAKGAKSGKNENLRRRSVQNSSKRMKRIDLRQKIKKNGSRTVNRGVRQGGDENALYRLRQILR
jgi:hypothetical protein